jgi:sulfatase-modifying factor enzyme 1
MAAGIALVGGVGYAAAFATAGWARSRLFAACEGELERASRSSPPDRPPAVVVPAPPPEDAVAEPTPSAREREILSVANEIGFGHAALTRRWLQSTSEDVSAASDPERDRTTDLLFAAWEQSLASDDESVSREGELRELATLLGRSGGSLLAARQRVAERLRGRGLRRLEAGNLAGATEDLRTAAETSPDPWAARADLARAEAAGGDPERARQLEFEVARHALSAGAPADAMAAVDRALARPGADRPTTAAALLLRASAALSLAATENETARRARVLDDVVRNGAVPAIESFAALGDEKSFADSVGLLGRAYREIGEDGRIRQLGSLLARRHPGRAAVLDSALASVCDSIASTATVGIARDGRGELYLPRGAHAELVLPGEAPRTLSVSPLRVPVADPAGAHAELRLSLEDGRRIVTPVLVLSGDSIRLDLDLIGQGFVFVPDRSRETAGGTTPCFYLDRFEVPNVDFAAFLNGDGAGDLRALVDRPGENFLAPWRRVPRPSPERIGFRPDEGDRPVTFVSPLEARRFAQWRGAVLGIADLRLPSEAEWQCAARATKSQPLPWGLDWSDDRVNAFEDDDRGEPCPVEEFPLGESFCGARQLAGNVAEIVETSPGAFAAVGGSYRHARGAGRPALLDERRPLAPGERAIDVGFRCLASARPGPPPADGLPDAVATASERRTK